MNKKFGRKTVFSILGVGCLSLMALFQNMSPVDYSPQKLLKLSGRVTEKTENPFNLQYHILGKVQHSLPEKFKSKADEITAAIIEESIKQGLDPVFIVAVIQTESGFNPNAKDKLGAAGLMQILPETGKWIAENSDIPWEGKKALFDPVYNIKVGTAYFAHLRDDADSMPSEYLRAYNALPAGAHKSAPLPKLKMKQALTKAKVSAEDESLATNGHILNKIYARKVMKNYSLLHKSFNPSNRKVTPRVAASIN